MTEEQSGIFQLGEFMSTPSYLTDSSGKPSHTRLLVVVTVLPLVLVPLAVWAILSLRSGILAEIPLTITGYLGAANAIILGYAGFKSSNENKPTAS
jgi:hypothetical protein